jgi:hypothetical protein
MIEKRIFLFVGSDANLKSRVSPLEPVTLNDIVSCIGYLITQISRSRLGGIFIDADTVAVHSIENLLRFLNKISYDSFYGKPEIIFSYTDLEKCKEMSSRITTEVYPRLKIYFCHNYTPKEARESILN